MQVRGLILDPVKLLVVSKFFLFFVNDRSNNDSPFKEIFEDFERDLVDEILP